MQLNHSLGEPFHTLVLCFSLSHRLKQLAVSWQEPSCLRIQSGSWGGLAWHRHFMKRSLLNGCTMQVDHATPTRQQRNIKDVKFMLRVVAATREVCWQSR